MKSFKLNQTEKKLMWLDKSYAITFATVHTQICKQLYLNSIIPNAVHQTKVSSFREQKERFNPQPAHFHKKLLEIAIVVPCKMLHLENPPPYVANNIAWKGNMFLVCVATPCYGMLVVNQLPSRIAQNFIVANGISPKSTCRVEIFGDISE